MSSGAEGTQSEALCFRGGRLGLLAFHSLSAKNVSGWKAIDASGPVECWWPHKTFEISESHAQLLQGSSWIVASWIALQTK